MKCGIRCIIICTLIIAYRPLVADDFDRWFDNKTMRVDIVHTGNCFEESVSLWQIKKEPHQPFNKKTLTEDLNSGSYCYKVYDLKSNQLLFVRGYSSLFSEWIWTKESKSGIQRAFQESLRFPYPKYRVRVALYRRDRQGQFHEIYYLDLDPEDTMICQDLNHSEFPVQPLKITGDPWKKVDILFLGDGYTRADYTKFTKDATTFMEAFLATSPYKEYLDEFNFRAIMPISIEAGPDEPERHIFKDTFFDASFNTFYIARYLTILNYWTVRDVSANAPYDVIIVIVNSPRYGGGGIYNYYNVFTSDNKESIPVFIHEVGHGFAGLADEYETETYDGFYDLEFEPWEPNLTIYTDKEKIKWGHLIEKATPLPTPPDSVYKNVVGAFEGGGYLSSGLFRPQLHCRMRSNHAVTFCKVCHDAIIRMIHYYTDGPTKKIP